jgi:hypothetical protein
MAHDLRRLLDHKDGVPYSSIMVMLAAATDATRRVRRVHEAATPLVK